MKPYEEICNTEDIIDSREVIARIEHLESEMEDYQETHRLRPLNHKKPSVKWQGWTELHEYKALLNLQEQCEGYGDWKYGEALIHEDYFVQYAKELAEDVCEMPRDIKWPYTCIDWDEAAEELKMDYMEVDFDGETYYMRSC